MDAELRARRIEVLDLVYSGRWCDSAMRELAKKYGVSASAMTQDMLRRDQWERLVLLGERKGKTVPKHAADLLNMSQLLLQKCYDIATNSRNENARVGALKSASALIERQARLRAQLGLLPSEKMGGVASSRKLALVDARTTNYNFQSKRAGELDRKVVDCEGSVGDGGDGEGDGEGENENESEESRFARMERLELEDLKERISNEFKRDIEAATKVYDAARVRPDGWRDGAGPAGEEPADLPPDSK